MYHRLILLPILVLSALPVHSQKAPRQSNTPVKIRKVIFENAALVSQRDRQNVVRQLKERDEPDVFVRTLNDLAEEAAERVRIVYQRNGYFKAEVFAESKPLHGDARQGNIVVTVVEPGRQYRLEGIRWSGLSIYSDRQLYSVMPIHSGEIFNRDKIANGLEEIRKLYASKGYINCTIVPEPEIHEDTGNILLTLSIDEGPQYVVGELSIAGLDDTKTDFLLSKWESIRGEPCSFEMIDNFFGTIFRTVPPGVSSLEYTRHSIDDESHVVSYSITFVPPPPDLTPDLAPRRR